MFMACIDKALQRFWTAIDLLRSKQIYAVITPAALAGKGSDRHQLYMGNAQFSKVGEFGSCCIECAFRGEGPNVQLVHDGTRKRWRLPVAVRPVKCCVVQYPRWTMHSLWLPGRTRIRQRRPGSIQDKRIIGPRCCLGNFQLPPAAGA